MDSSIPKLIHQTFPVRQVPPPIEQGIHTFRMRNPEWNYSLYDDHDILDFIRSAYGQAELAAYMSLSPSYGAARADLFRYLLMYKAGGIYLDIKSMFVEPLHEVLTLKEGFVLSKWRNGLGEPFQGSGIHPELAAYPRGEFEQWFIICEPGHPYLAAVIEAVLRNIARYRPWSGGVGRTGVLRLTGPIAYTLAIEPIKARYRHVEVRSHDEIGLRYNILGSFDHRALFKQHYTQMDTAVVRPEGLNKATTAAYIAARRLKHRLFRPNEVL